jgi:tRNA-2-methylthio-N6-dimethylallyladenosine synthase
MDGTDSCNAHDGRAVYAEIFGCQMNKMDGQIALETLLGRGYRLVRQVRDAGLVLFFTCAVRQHAEDRFFSRLGAYARIKEQRPDLVIAVCGCVAEEHGASILERFPFVDIVCGTRHFHELPELVGAARPGNPVAAVGEGTVTYARTRNLGIPAAQAYVEIMRGCDLSCTYCIVPRVRGREVSRPPEEICREVAGLVDRGVVEVTLLGQTVNSYGRSLGAGATLAGLLRRLAEIPGLRRIRFVTSHPRFMTDDLIAAMAEIPAVCEGLHLPAQSGSDRVLRRMARTYTREQYCATIEKCRERIPGFALAGDCIVGFPGETDEDFAQTESLIRAARYQQLFVFKYSERPGTPAARLTDDVPTAVKEARNRRLLELHKEIALELYRQAVGTAVEVLVEGPSSRNPEKLTGRTRQGQIVIFPGPAQSGRLRRVLVRDATALALYGDLVPEEFVG